MNLKIAIAGASGFIGRSLMKEILKETDHKIIALSRRKKSSKEPRINWRQCDMYSLKDIQEGLSGADIAIYLVHSMLPTARLSQGNFADYDLILADNFARAAKKESLKQIIYLGGIIPDAQNISEHLRSRVEVESALAASGVPLTSLRAGVVLGPEGSSFTMMLNLVKRLPFMICPSWTSTLSNPIAIWDVHQSILEVLNKSQHFSKHYDIGGSETVSYRDMMLTLAKNLKKKRLFISIPFVSPRLSKLWVSLITGAPSDLVYPLVESLKTHMVPDKNFSLDIDKDFTAFSDAIEKILKETPKKSRPNAFKYTGITQSNEVRSIQRLQSLYRFKAIEVASHYFKWLPQFWSPLIRIVRTNARIYFKISLLPGNALILEYSPDRSSKDRQLFYIRGGYLALGEGRGRLEFRNIINDRYTLAAIHEFKPALPWYLYKYTQALIHLFTMKAFDKHLIELRKTSN